MAKRKFKFVEDFVDENGNPYPNLGSPAYRKPSICCPEGWYHQIARIEYKTETRKEKTYTTTKEGQLVEGEAKNITVYIEKMGVKGGWVQKMTNLSNDPEDECWLSSGYISENAFVGGNVQISGAEIGGNAKVMDDATISSGVGITGNAYVYGEATVSSTGVSVYGNARVGGEVSGSSSVYGNAEVSDEGVVSGGAKVFGNAKIYGDVQGDAEVSGDAVVYGIVTGSSKVSGTTFVGINGRVEGEAVVDGGIIQGVVSDSSRVSGEPLIQDGAEVKDESEIGGNAVVSGKLNEGAPKVGGNSHVGANGSVLGTTEVSGNVYVGGKITDTETGGGGCLSGDIDSAKISEDCCALVLDVASIADSELRDSPIIAGNVNNGTVGDGAIMGVGTSSNEGVNIGNSVLAGEQRNKEGNLIGGSGGSNEGKMDGNSVVGSSGKNTGDLDGNAKVKGSSIGSVSGNCTVVGNISVDLKDNAVAVQDTTEGNGNQVVLDGEDEEPGDGYAAVLCKVT